MKELPKWFWWLIVTLAILLVILVVFIIKIRYTELGAKIIGYSCPDVEFIDCMPKVIGPNDPVELGGVSCSGSYHDWMRDNCDVEFAY